MAKHGMLRIALKCRARWDPDGTPIIAHTIFATTLPWGV